MKINRKIKLKNKLLSLNIAKSKLYKTTINFDLIKINNIKFKLKKALKIIYKYHISNKQIAFIGTPLKFNKQLKYALMKRTKHITVPDTNLLNGSISQKQNYNKTKNSKILFKLNKNPELIVLLSNRVNTNILAESYKAKLITIYFNKKSTSDNSSYKLTGNSKFLQDHALNNFFYSILLSILKNN